jgi:hypothetical protein
MKTIAYLHSVYARAGDTFIRAEVRQLRSFGHTVHTFSVREPDASELVSQEIRDEHARTDYILGHGFLCLLLSAIRELLRAPRRTFATLKVAARWVGLGSGDGYGHSRIFSKLAICRGSCATNTSIICMITMGRAALSLQCSHRC